MRIAVYASTLLEDSPADTGNIATELCYRLCSQHPDAQFLMVTNRPGTLGLPANARPIFLKPWLKGSIGGYLWRHFQWPAMLKKMQADRLLCIAEVLPPLPGMLASLLLTRSAAMLDKPVASQYIRRFNNIAVFSDFMREQVNQRYGGLSKRVHLLPAGAPEACVPLDWEEREDVKRSYTGGMEYYIAVGRIGPENNIMPLLKAFSMMKKRLRSGIKLVLAGSLASEGRDIPGLLKTYKFRDDIVWLQDVDDVTLARLIAGAYAIVHTAGADGMAAPVYAALKSQVPGVVLYAGANTEAGGDAMLNAVPDDVSDLAEKMSALYKDEQLRSRLIAHIQPVNNWNDAATVLGRLVIS